jgi:hypothetical protein
MGVNVEIMKLYHKLTKDYQLKKIFEYLNTLQKTGITNMFGATPYLYGGREWIQKQIDYFDIEEDENVEKLLDMSDEIKDSIISGALKRQEREETNNFIRSIERRVQQEAKDILKIWMSFKGKVLKESIIIETKYNKKDAANFLFRRVTKEELDDEFKETYQYYSDYWKKFKHNDGTLSQFKQVFITSIMDKIHGKLIDGFLGKSPADLYNKIMGIINEIYGDYITKLWTQKTGQRV